jgi:hypothetical protein
MSGSRFLQAALPAVLSRVVYTPALSGEPKMIPPFDVFRVESNEQVLWIAAVNSLEEAKARVQKEFTARPSDYVIRSAATGRQEKLLSADIAKSLRIC